MVDIANIIEVNKLKKHFTTFRKDAGFLSTVKSLVNRDYVTVKALDGISFEVEKGEIRGFIGPNGAGKSTTIKILSGILYPTEGTVKVNDYRPWHDREKYVKRIGVVFGQKPQLWPDLPAIDTFHLNKTLYEIPKKKFNKNLKYFVELFDLKEIIRRPVRQLSLGEKMKCELISSLLHDPDVVFLDEPTIGLDLISKEKIRSFIKKVNKEIGVTILLTTHDLDDIENLCENILIINKGKLVFNGQLEELKKDVLKTKILDIKFYEKVKTFKEKSMKGVKVLFKNDFELKLEINLQEQEIKSVVNKIINRYPIQDINIGNPPIESVIKRIYED